MSKNAPKRKPGRPPTYAGARAKFNIRLTPAIRERLIATAQQTGISVSALIERLVEKALLVDDIIGDVAAFKRQAIGAEAHRQGYGVVHAPEGPRYFAPGSHNIPQSGFITPQEAAMPQPAYGLPPAVREAIREEIRAALAEATPARRKGAA
jgi:hypothetical protein